MKFRPKSLDDFQAHMPNLDTLIPMDNLDSEEDRIWPVQPEEDVEAESEITLEETEKRDDQLRLTPIRREAVNKAWKAEQRILTMSLVHGDVVILEGDDFEVMFLGDSRDPI